MSRLIAVTLLAAVAMAAQSAAACDWNREASTTQQLATAVTPPQPSQTTASSPQTANAASESSKPVEPTAPIVQVSGRQ